MNQAPPAPFKACTTCETHWARLADFIHDPYVVVNGYQAAFDEPDKGLILFTHTVPGCNSTLSLRVGLLREFYTGPHYPELLREQPECPGHCLTTGNIEACNAHCSMRWIRDLLQSMRLNKMPAELSDITRNE